MRGGASLPNPAIVSDLTENTYVTCDKETPQQTDATGPTWPMTSAGGPTAPIR